MKKSNLSTTTHRHIVILAVHPIIYDIVIYFICIWGAVARAIFSGVSVRAIFSIRAPLSIKHHARRAMANAFAIFLHSRGALFHGRSRATHHIVLAIATRICHFYIYYAEILQKESHDTNPESLFLIKIFYKRKRLSAATHGHVILAILTLATHHHGVVVLAVLTHSGVILTILAILARRIVLAITTSVSHLVYS